MTAGDASGLRDSWHSHATDTGGKTPWCRRLDHWTLARAAYMADQFHADNSLRRVQALDGIEDEFQ